MLILRINLDKDERWFKPGESITGKISWHNDAQVDSVEVHLCWFTQGKGSEDVGIVSTWKVPQPGPSGNSAFTFTAPEGPYSFAGSLVSLSWTLELIVLPPGETERVDILVGPRPAEIILEPVHDS